MSNFGDFNVALLLKARRFFETDRPISGDDLARYLAQHRFCCGRVTAPSIFEQVSA